jgi:SAM-dependent methyltransferase
MQDEAALRQQVMGMVQGTMTLQVAFVGVSSGALASLNEAGVASTSALATRSGLDEGYLEDWCAAAYAFSLVDRETAGWRLTPLGVLFCPDTPGTLMPAAFQAAFAAHMSDHAVTGLRTGAQPGEAVLGEKPNLAAGFGAMLELGFGGIFENEILPTVPVFAELGARGGVAVDLGCGNGWYLRRLAAAYPTLTGVGLDGMQVNIADAQAQAAAAGLSDRLRFEQGDVHQLALLDGVDLVAMNRALHHVWQGHAALFQRIAAALRPGGAVVIWEPRWPDDLTELRGPPMRPLAFQNLAEHVQGNHFLRPAEICEALTNAGLEPEQFSFMGGREVVVVGRKSGA